MNFIGFDKNLTSAAFLFVTIAVKQMNFSSKKLLKSKIFSMIFLYFFKSDIYISINIIAVCQIGNSNA